jgi:hypothetical protein
MKAIATSSYINLVAILALTALLAALTGNGGWG